MATLNGFDLSSARVHLPHRGVWHACARLDARQDIGTGGPARLVVGSLELVGTILSGGPWLEFSEYVIVGGAGGWVKPVGKAAYRSDGGVLLSQVAADVAARVGESIALQAGVERVLGPAWERPGGWPAARVLDDLTQAWWVRDDGVTVLGARPLLGLVTADYSVTDYSPVMGGVTLAVPDDDPAPFAIGAELPGDSLPAPFRIDNAVIHFDDRSLRINVWSRE